MMVPMNDTHSPAPWRIVRGSEYTLDAEDTKILRIEAADGAIVLWTDSGYFMPREANTALIAAAPDLLAAAREALTSLPECGALKQLRAAIEKAVGIDTKA